MGMEIGPDPAQKRHLVRGRQSMQKEQIRANEAKWAGQARLRKTKDSIQKRQQDPSPLKLSEEMGRPLLPQSTGRFARMSDAIVNARLEFDLPTVKKLLSLLPPKLQQKIQEMRDGASLDEPDAVVSRKFLNLISRFIPLSASLLHGLGSNESLPNLPQIQQSITDTLQEIEELTTQYTNPKILSMLVDSLQASPEIIPQMAALLAQGGEEIPIIDNWRLIKFLIDAHLLPPSVLSKKTINRSLLHQVLAAAGKPMAPTLYLLASSLKSIDVFPKPHRAEMLKVMLSTESLLSLNPTSPILGRHTLHLARNLAHLSTTLSQSLGVIPTEHEAQTKPVSEYCTHLFAGLITTAALIGRLAVDRGDGEARGFDDDDEAGMVQRSIMRELDLYDLPPFSFFALWAPFVAPDPDHRRQQREAAAALSAFMRLLMRLVFLLVAIYTGGKKMGGNGTDLLLQENQDYLYNYLNELIAALKILQEKFGVDVKTTVERMKAAKKSLLDMDYAEFWHQIFQSLQEKSSLSDFLEEVDATDHLYQTIRTLVNGSGFDTSAVRM